MLAGPATSKRVLGYDPHVSGLVERGRLPQDDRAVEGLKLVKCVKINDKLRDKDRSVTGNRTEGRVGLESSCIGCSDTETTTEAWNVVRSVEMRAILEEWVKRDQTKATEVMKE